MKKIIALLLSLICLMGLFGCAEDKEEGNTYADVNIEAIKTQIIDELGVEGTMDMGVDMLTSYGIEEKDIKESACFITMDGVFPDEIIMIKATDSDAAERVAEKLETRLKAVLEQSKNYDAENYSVAQKCKVTVKGHLVTLFISAQNEGMQEIFESALK